MLELKNKQMAEQKIKPNDTVTIYGTGKMFMKPGQPYKVHKIQAEKLISKGAATADKPKEKSKG